MTPTHRNGSGPKIIVLGAGFAGISAVRYLREHGLDARIFEASSRIAGQAGSVRDESGFTCDVGVHITTNRLAASVGYSAKCERSPSYGESVRVNGRYSSYPFGLAMKPRYAVSAVGARAASVFGRPCVSAADWFRRSFGRALADEVALPLLEAWSGTPADRLSAEVGRKMPSSILRTMYLRLVARLVRRTVSVGYGRTLRDSTAVSHVYPTEGMGALCRHMIEPIEDTIELETPVEKIYVDEGRAVGVRAGGRDHEADVVVSTAPVHILPRLVEGSDALDGLESFRYRPMVFVNLMMNGRGLLPNAVVWTPESRFPFLRITETPLQTPSVAPEGKTIISADIGCTKGDEVWSLDDELLGQFCLEPLRELIPDVDDRYIGCRVVRTPMAYPVFDLEYEDRRLEFAKSTGIENLHSIGRNGEFDHLLLEDVFWRTRYRMRGVVEEFSRPTPTVTA